MLSEYDFIVVGSGAGGGPLACRLAQDPAGYRVALIDAGADPATRADGTDNFNYSVPVLHARATEDADLSLDYYVRHYSDDRRQNSDSKLVPENTPDPDGARDPRRNGVFYPRAGAWGGCTSHNAMITIYPHDEDWAYIRALTGDPSWSPDAMRSYFERLENCRYANFDDRAGRHGFGNWLSTSLLGLDVLKSALHEGQIFDVVLGALKAHVQELLFVPDGSGRESHLKRLVERGRVLLKVVNATGAVQAEKQKLIFGKLRDAVLDPDRAVSQLAQKLRQVSLDLSPALAADQLIDEFRRQWLDNIDIRDLIDLLVWRVDPNDWRVVQAGLTGLVAIPLATDGARRSGPREWIRATLDNCPYRLDVLSGGLVTKVVFDRSRAVGIKYVAAPHAYAASRLNKDRSRSPLPPIRPEDEREIRVRREIILAGGAFNTPQLLLLSGIGPREVLEEHRIPPLLGRYWPGVGRNLQDRYEVAIVSELKDNFHILGDCSFEEPQDISRQDACFHKWWRERGGVYTTNGALFGDIKRSRFAEHLLPPGSPGLSADPPPDLFLFSLLGRFKGYYPGYSREVLSQKNILTWAILKGHTRNNIGEVKLRSIDPREPPLVNFKYFNDGQPDADSQKDLGALIEGVQYVQRALSATGSFQRLLNPNLPLDALRDSAQLREFVMNEAWGHHACGTCKIGRDPGDGERAVVSSDFRVHGVEGLRVVDASVFPRIPGFFIVTPVYMIAEKAAEDILRDGARTQAPRLS